MKNVYLTKYSPKSIIIRVAVVSLIAVLYMQLLLYIIEMVYHRDGNTNINEYLVLVLGFNLLVEANLVLDSIYEKIFPLPNRLTQRMIVNFLIAGYLKPSEWCAV